MEAEMDYAFAKHMQLMAKGRLLRVQYETLENLPVGIEAIQEDLDRLQEKNKETEGETELNTADPVS